MYGKKNQLIKILSYVWVTTDGGWISNWIYWTLTEVTTNNYSANANWHTLQFTTACMRSSQSAVSLAIVAGNCLTTN
jgi:hypothetical protein